MYNMKRGEFLCMHIGIVCKICSMCGGFNALNFILSFICTLTYRCLSFVYAADGFLKKFFEKTKNMNPKERGKYLEEDEVLI